MAFISMKKFNNRFSIMIVFGLVLCALVALGLWWTVFFSRSVELERQARLAELTHQAQIIAVRLGHRPDPENSPVLGVLSEQQDIEIVEIQDSSDVEPFVFALEPNFPNLGVRPTGQAIEHIEHRLERRRLMVIGEGAFLFVLLAFLFVMLHRLVFQEFRHLRRMEAFVSAFTHEMKTPLAGIKSLLQTLSAGRVPADRQQELFELGLSQTDRLSHAIDNVLLSGKIRAGRFMLNLGPVALRTCLERAVERCKGSRPNDKNDLTIDWDLKESAAKVVADEEPLGIILENLIDNGLKYGEGSEVRISVSQESENMIVSVIDGGVGFDPQKAEQLFVPFERGEREQQRDAPGTGLGLSIARTLARKMGGDVTCESPGPGKGATFRLLLKLTEIQRGRSS